MKRPSWGNRLAALALAGAGCHACGGADHRSAPAAGSAADDGGAAALASASASAPLVAAASSSAASDPPLDDWRLAARRFQWRRAYELLSALPEDQRGQPGIRLALGHVAIEAGEHAAAVAALDGLAEQLPLAKDEIETLYARAAAVAGPHDKAAAIYERSAKVRDLVRAAEAWERAGDLKKARAVADKAVALAQRTRRGRDEEHAHAVRARIAEQAKAIAVAAGDYRWLAQHAAHPGRARLGVEGTDRLKGRLGVEERVEALARSSTRDNLDATLASLDELAKKHPAEAAFIALGKARAIYQVRDYARAAAAYEAVAAQGSAWVPEALYYAARCAARSDKPEVALERYQKVAREHTRSPWAERAAQRRAELLLNLGRFEEAADAFLRYLARYGKSPTANEAHYGRALALLSGGKAADARKLLTNLRRKEDERRAKASLQHLEGVAALRAGEVELAKKLWLELVREQPLTFPALAAHARLKTTGHAPLPPLMSEPKPAAASALAVELPEAPRLFASLGLDVLAEQRLARMEQEAAERYAGRESEALCAMYGQLTGAGRRHQIGSRAVSLEVLMRPPSAAERWAWDCVYPHPYPDIVRREEQRNGLPAGLVHAIMRQESAFRARAVSPVGARGLMQLMPNTAARAAAELELAFDPKDTSRPDVNVRLGAYYIGKLLKGFHQSTPLAVAAYNAGPHAVARWLGGGDRDADLWVARIPYRETRHYVGRVLANLSRYQYLAGGTDAITPLELELPARADIGDDAY